MRNVYHRLVYIELHHILYSRYTISYYTDKPTCVILIFYTRMRPAARPGNTLDIYGVYFAFLDVRGNDWDGSRAKELVQTQLRELKEIGLAAAVKEFHVVFTCNDHSILLQAKKSVRDILPDPKFHIHIITGNPYEYPGILCAWNVAQRIPVSKRNTSVVLYFHSKGMSNGRKDRIKTEENKMLTNYVLHPWREIVARFQSEPGLNKAGYAAAKHGWIWYNFWWARASYLAICPEPILTDRRHYYEDWLGRINNGSFEHGTEPGGFTTSADCLSLCKSGPSGNLGVHLHPALDAC